MIIFEDSLAILLSFFGTILGPRNTEMDSLEVVTDDVDISSKMAALICSDDDGMDVVAEWLCLRYERKENI